MQFNGRMGEVSCQHGVATWKVGKFCSLSDWNDIEFFLSPLFDLKGCRWFFRLCPIGACNDSWEGYVRLDLCFYYKSNLYSTPVQLRYSLGIQEADGKTGVWATGRKSFLLFDSKVSAEGRVTSELLRRREELLPQDVLTVIATLEKDVADVEGESFFEKGVIRDIEKLWVSGEYSDVVLKVKDVEFKAHRNILAVRSPILRAMFQHDTAEKDSFQVTIDDCEPAVFDQLLNFIYTGEPRVLNDENLVTLYIVADKYLVNELKALCLYGMKEELCVETFCPYVKLSLMYNELELLEIAIDYFSENMIHVVKTVEWQRFSMVHSTWGKEIMIRALEQTEARNERNSS